MKYKTTQKEIKQTYKEIIQVNYCALQNLLSCESSEAYTSGTYGWNADIYMIDGVAIVTGYRPFGNLKPSYELCNKFDTLAAQVNANYHDFQKRKDKLRTLITKFINETIYYTK